MRERPVSVTLFGILNIGIGLLELGGVLLSTMFESSDLPAASPASSSFLAPMLALWNAISTDPAYAVWRRITVPLDAAASLALVAAGIGLLLLQHWSRLLSIGCAIYKILFVFLDCAVLFVALHRVLAGALPGRAGADIAFVVAAAVLGAILTLAYPALLIYFLTRPKAVLALQPAPASPL
jgi:hypothetical protein